MPVKVEKRGDKFCVVGPDGKLEGKCHSTKEAAVKQVQAINLSKRRKEGKPAPKSKSGIDLVAEENIRVMAAELNAAHGTEQPPIVVMSDGTPENTHLMINGQMVPFKRMDIYCNRSDKYPSCSVSITTEQTDENGLLVEKTLTLRKEPPEDKATCVGQTKKKKPTRKLDPSAKVRKRGDVVFASTHPKVTDNKDHFPINDADQARNALSRVAQFSAAPKWWSGSLKQVQSAVRSAVKRKFKGINVTEANCKEGFALFYTTGSFRWVREN